jgi:restriction modification system DNA specificity subunit
MKQYPKYKDSGVSWIGEIPKGWEVASLKRYLSETMKYGASESGEINQPSWTRYIRITDIDDNGNLKNDGVKTLNPNIAKDYMLKKGDVLFARSGATVGKSFLYNSDKPACFAGYLIKAVCNKHLLSSFLLAYTKSAQYDDWKNSTFIQATIQNIGADKYMNMPIVIPSIPEQRAIVSFLDKKTTQIDCFITEAEHEIEKLSELKQAQIAHLVTHGTNPDAPMKESGIAWIGQIPEHWEVNKIRSHFKERRTKVSDKDYPALSVAREGIVPQLDTAVKTDNGDNRKLVLKNDFVVNSRSDRKGSCGVSDYDGSVSLISIVLEPHDINPQYVHYLFRSNNYVEEFYRNGRGIVADLWTTRYSEMRNIFIPIPPVSEQKDIVSAINSLNNKIDTLVSELTTQINHLKELKQRVISDAVTGKIDVREVNN